MCPVSCLVHFRGFRRDIFSPVSSLLVHADGSFLSRFQFISVFSKGIRNLYLDESLYAGHSFRIGAAMEAARLGVGEEVINGSDVGSPGIFSLTCLCNCAIWCWNSW